MKKLFVFLSLFSVVSCFAAAPKGIAPADAPIHGLRDAQAFNLLREAIEQKAWESETGELSHDNIRDFLKKERYHWNSKCFLKNLKQKALESLKLSCWGISCGFSGWLKHSKKASTLKSFVALGLIAGFGLYVYPFINAESAEDIFGSLWKSKDYTPILDSKFNSIDYNFVSTHWDKFLVTDYDHLNYFDQVLAVQLQRDLQKFYPRQYPNVYSLKIDFEPIKAHKRAECAMQALVGDAVNADGTERRCNNCFTQTMQMLLSR